MQSQNIALQEVEKFFREINRKSEIRIEILEKFKNLPFQEWVELKKLLEKF